MSTPYTSRLECVEGTANKFYEQTITETPQGFLLDQSWGGIGKAPQRTKGWPRPSDYYTSFEAAKKALDAVVKQKTAPAKGYQPVGLKRPRGEEAEPEAAKKVKAAFGPTLAERYVKQNVDGWMMSEKLDGIRAVWREGELRTRNGHRIVTPPGWTDAWDATCEMDGELYIGRGIDDFNEVSGLARGGAPTHERWARVTFQVFDAIRTDATPFTARYEAVKAFVAAARAEGASNVAVVEHTTVCDPEAFLDSIIAQGGEGIMLRNPRAPYEQRRSKNLLKHKRFEELEVTVVGHEPGVGRLAGLTGALRCELNGVEFSVGSGLTDEERATPPPVGAMVTIKFPELFSSGVPRQPVYKAVRGASPPNPPCRTVGV